MGYAICLCITDNLIKIRSATSYCHNIYILPFLMQHNHCLNGKQQILSLFNAAYVKQEPAGQIMTLAYILLCLIRHILCKYRITSLINNINLRLANSIIPDYFLLCEITDSNDPIGILTCPTELVVI